MGASRPAEASDWFSAAIRNSAHYAPPQRIGDAARYSHAEPSQRAFAIDDQLDDRPAGVRRLRFRPIAWRFIGVLAVAGAFYGAAQIAARAEARKAILDWATLGNGASARDASDTVRRWVGEITAR